MKILLFNNLQKLISYLFCVFISISAAWAGGNENAGNSAPSVSYPKLLNEAINFSQFTALDQEIGRLMKEWSITGASFAMMKDGKLVYTRGYGYADRQGKIKVQPQHRFRIASVSKLITAAAIMKLQEWGLLGLDEPVFGPNGILRDSIYIAAIRDKRVYRITTRHLLTHAAGWDRSKKGDPMFMTSYIARESGLPADSLKEQHIIQYVLSQPLDFYPGTESHYSNLGYVVLGKIIEKVSHSDYESFVQQQILQPAGIQSMQMGRNGQESRLTDEVKYYDLKRVNDMLMTRGNFVPRPYGRTDVELLGASGGWVANPIDLLRFASCIDGFKEVSDFLDSASIQQMIDQANDKILPMGWIGVNANNDWWRTGTLAGTSALLIRKHDNTLYVFLTNSSTEAGNSFPTRAYAAIEKGLRTIDQLPENNLFNYLDRQLATIIQKPPKLTTSDTYSPPLYAGLNIVVNSEKWTLSRKNRE